MAKTTAETHGKTEVLEQRGVDGTQAVDEIRDPSLRTVPVNND